MNATATVNPGAAATEQLKAKLKATWMAGDYDRFSRYMEKGARAFYSRLGIEPGANLLDVACGAGQLALIAARAGAHVTGCDIATNWLELARTRAEAEDLPIAFEEGDAEALPYANDEFDAVVSVVGAMFAPRPDLVAAEMTRVCRPGGIVAMANWTAEGFVGQMLKTIARYIAPSGMPSPLLWGDEDTVRQRLGSGMADIRCCPRLYRFEYPFGPEAVVEFFCENYGPMVRAVAALDSEGQSQLKRELTALWSIHNQASGYRTEVDAEYLEVIATRAGRPEKVPVRKTPQSSRRATLLADRLEQGAAQLAAFAETMTDAEWRKPVSSNDARTLGTIVHHVASMYPIEIDVARAAAGGKPIVDVTWDLVAQINANHAQEHAGETKTEALNLLRRNSHEAAEVIRSFTDEQLDTAVPFSLSYGAPMTTQFVLEDHAVRHSWHHLARIRKAVGR
jgi:SAM-dependent methyltransferase